MVLFAVADLGVPTGQVNAAPHFRDFRRNQVCAAPLQRYIATIHTEPERHDLNRMLLSAKPRFYAAARLLATVIAEAEHTNAPHAVSGHAWGR